MTEDEWPKLNETEIVIQEKFAGQRFFPVEVKTYPGGEPLVAWDSIPDAHGPVRLIVRPKNMTTLVAAMFFADAIRHRGWETPELILPLVPGSRQDRLNSQGDFLFTARSVAEMINARNFPSVTIFDPHSDVTPALINNCRIYSASDLIEGIFASSKWGAIVAPDAGAEKRAGAVAALYGIPLLHGWKKRDVATGKLTGFGLEPVPDELAGSRVLVVDDLCDGGGTFLGLADVLDEAGLTADLYVTHGLFSRGTEELLGRFGSVICTDSVVSDKAGVLVIPACFRNAHLYASYDD